MLSEVSSTAKENSQHESKSETLTDDELDGTHPHLPLDGGITAWLVVLSCFIYNFNLLGFSYAFGVYQAHYALHEFPDESPQIISLIGSVCVSLTLSVGIPVGRAVELFGFRKVAFLGSVIFVGSLVAAGFCRTVPALIVTQGVLNGIGAGMMFVPANTATAQWFVKRRALSLGIATAGSGMGGIFWSFVIRAIISRMGYQWSLWLSACISAFTCSIAFLFLKERPAKPNSRHVSIWSTLAMFKNSKFVALYCASALSVFGYMVPYFYVPTYAQTQLQRSNTVGSILLAVMDLGMIAGRIGLGLLADSKVGNMNSVIAGMALSGISLFALWLPATRSLPLLYIFSFTYGFLGGGYIGLLPAVLAFVFDPDKLPGITGVFYTSELPGQLAGGPVAGALLTGSHGHWTPVIVYSGITLFCGSLFAAVARFKVNRRILATV